MKRKNPLIKSFYLLGAAVGLILLSVFVLKPQFQKEKEQKEKSDLLWKNTKRDKILEISVNADGKNYSLKRSAESKEWIVDVETTFDADSSTVDSLISSLLGIKKEGTLDTTPEKVGLDVPKFEIKVVYTDENDKSVTQHLQIGEDSPVDYQSYAKWKDEPEIFMISKSLKFSADKTASDFRNKKIFDYKLAEFKEIKVAGQKNYKLELGEGGKWWLHLNNRKLAADAAVLSDWMNSLSLARVSLFASDDKKEIGLYGLKKPAVTLNLLTLKDEKPEWKIGHIKNSKENKAFAINNKSESIYEMPLTFLDQLNRNPSEFRNKRIATFDKAKVKKITYNSKELQIELNKEGDTWKGVHVHKGVRSEGKANSEAMEKLVNSLAIIRAVDFVEKSPKSASLGLGNKKVEIFEESAAPQLSFEIGNKIKNDTIIWGANFEDPVLSLLDFDDLFPQNAQKLIEAAPAPASVENKSLDKNTPSGASSGKGKMMKLEKSVANVKDLKKLPAPIVEKGAKYSALITFKNGRKLKVEFASDKAPYTVSNFIHLARNGFYDGVSYHRVIADFVVQGGDPTGTGRGGPGWMFDNEDNDLKHVKGALSMAHAGRNTNGSQFFIVLAPQPHLDGLHTVFGQVTDGLNEIDQIKQGDTMASVEVFQEQ